MGTANENTTPTSRKDRIWTIGLWIFLLTVAWSLPVLDVIQNHRERARMESGVYYTPKMPPEWYMQTGN